MRHTHIVMQHNYILILINTTKHKYLLQCSNVKHYFTFYSYKNKPILFLTEVISLKWI